MFVHLSVVLIILGSICDETVAEICFTRYGSYYCSRKSFAIRPLSPLNCSICLAGETCGTYYGDCRGLSAYVIAAIVFSGITFLSICVRCCIQISSASAVRTRTRARTANAGLVRVQVHSPTRVPVHTIVEDAPPNYDVAVLSKNEPPKY
jgi:hypothetical protein